MFMVEYEVFNDYSPVIIHENDKWLSNERIILQKLNYVIRIKIMLERDLVRNYQLHKLEFPNLSILFYYKGFHLLIFTTI